MALTGEEIRARLSVFAAKWSVYDGGERSEAQSDHDEIADVSRRLYARRSEICLERQIGLTKLYNQMDDGAWRDLRDLHAELDEAVAAAYGWPRAVAHDTDETNRRLLELNRQIAAGECEYHPFG